MGRIIAIASQKGGVGKTTTAISLGAGLGLAGRRTLLIDVDPQANASSGLGAPMPAAHGTADILLGEQTANKAIVREIAPGLDLLPAGGPMRPLERRLAMVGGASPRLVGGLTNSVRDGYAYVLLDCPPSLGALTTAVLAAAEGVLVPVQCEYYAMEGLAQVVGLLDHLRDSGHGGATLFGVLMTMYDSGSALSREVVAEVRRYFADTVFASVIPRDEALSEAPGYGRSIFDYDIRSRGAFAYLQLVREVINRG